MAETDTILLERWSRQRDARAFQELVERYSKLVHGTARRIVASGDQADDVTQECFLKLSQLTSSDILSLPAWLHRVATRRAISVLRSESRRRRLESSVQPRERETEQAPWEEVEVWVDQAIEALPEEIRVPIVEHFLRGRTQTAVAAELGLSREAVGYRVRKGIDRIRASLKRRGLLTTSAGLAAGFASLEGSTAAVLPATLVASLGKIALSGRPAPVAPGAASSAGGPLSALSAKVALPVLAGALLILAGVSFLLPGGDSPSGEDATTPPVSVAPATSLPPQDEPVELETEEPAEIAAAESPSPVEEPVAGTRLAGRVLPASEGDPVEGARVVLFLPPADFDRHDDILLNRYLARDYLHPDRVLETTAAADGSFTFTIEREEGQVRLQARDDAHASPLAFLKVEDEAKREAIELQLGSAREVEGKVFGAAGEPLPAAVISIYHSYNDKGLAGGGGLTTGDEQGAFSLAIHPEATHLTLRVAVPGAGQGFFTAVEVAEAPWTLRLSETGSLSGEITWGDGAPAEAVEVVVEAEVPVPEPLQTYSGWRRRHRLTALTDAGGRYEIAGLQPGFRYQVFVIDPEIELRVAQLQPLSPRFNADNTIEVMPAQRAVWDREISRQIRLHGRVTTEKTGRALPYTQVAFRKDGKWDNFFHCETDVEGRYDVTLNQGPGSYLVTAHPQGGSNEVRALLGETHGKSLTLARGDERELDLLLPEPARIPIRVLDATGEPLPNLGYEFSAHLPGGKRVGLSTTGKLDEGGRYLFEFFYPIERLTLEVRPFRGGPGVPSGDLFPRNGEALEEITFQLPEVFDLRGVIVDVEGQPLDRVTVYARSTYDDGTHESLGFRTEKDGSFALEGKLLVAPQVIQLRESRGKRVWVSGRLEPTVGESVDLGTIALVPPQ